MTVDMQTRYLGLTLSSPLVASAGPLTGDLEQLHRLEAAGAGAAVLPSLFEEQVEREEMELHRLQEYYTEKYAESLSYLPEVEDYEDATGDYVRKLQEAKRAVGIPIIASLNGDTHGGWLRYAAILEKAGADALELNLYLLPTSPETSGSDVEARCLKIVREVRNRVRIPLAVKLAPMFSSLPHFARQLAEAGADGLVLFNRFFAPDLDLETLTVHPHLELSTRAELLHTLRWIGILRDPLGISLAASSGVHDPDDIVKALAVGADAVMCTSALLLRGAEHARTLIAGTRAWLAEREYTSVEQFKGSVSRERSGQAEAFERANYIKAITSYTSELH